MHHTSFWTIIYNESNFTNLIEKMGFILSWFPKQCFYFRWDKCFPCCFWAFWSLVFQSLCTYVERSLSKNWVQLTFESSNERNSIIIVCKVSQTSHFYEAPFFTKILSSHSEILISLKFDSVQCSIKLLFWQILISI